MILKLWVESKVDGDLRRSETVQVDGQKVLSGWSSIKLDDSKKFIVNGLELYGLLRH